MFITFHMLSSQPWEVSLRGDHPLSGLVKTRCSLISIYIYILTLCFLTLLGRTNTACNSMQQVQVCLIMRCLEREMPCILFSQRIYYV